MRKLFLFFMLSLGLLSNAVANEKRAEMARYSSAYSGGAGYNVWIARFGPRENQEVLLQINGIDHELDRRVVRAKGVPSSGGVKYTATIGGKLYELLEVRGANAELRITGAPWVSSLTFDKALAGERPPEHLLNSYLESNTK